MEIDVGDAGSALLDLASETTQCLTVVAPFIKLHALARVVEQLPESADVVVVTRWHLVEILSGVSDIAVWNLVSDRGGILLLDPRLHAKIYSNEQHILISSANVTGAALGWNRQPNREVIGRPHPDHEEATRRYVGALIRQGRRVDEELYQYFLREVGEQQVVSETAADPLIAHAFDEWLPKCRDPNDVVLFYKGDLSQLTGSACVAAEFDLLALDTPRGLTPEQLRTHIGMELFQHPFVSQLRGHLSERRRFGEVRDLLARNFGLGRNDASDAWQTLLRWLVHFQPGLWEYCKPRHSEMLVYVAPQNRLP